MDGQFLTWTVAITCTQMQLNLRTAVYHVPTYATTFYQQRTLARALESGDNPSRQPPGVETLLFGGTASELERKYNRSSTDSGMEPEEQYASNALATHSVHPQGKIDFPAVDFSTGPPSPQGQRANFFQSPPLHPLGHNADTAVLTNVTKEEERAISPIDLEPQNRLMTRKESSSAKSTHSALGFKSKHNWALARPTSGSGAVVTPPKPKKQNRNAFQDGIPLNDLGGVASSDYLEAAPQGDLPRSVSESNLQVEVQVEREGDESGILPSCSEHEGTTTQTAPEGGGILESRVGVWR